MGPGDRAGRRAGRRQVAAGLGLTHSHRTEGWTVLESGSVSYGKATSYLPVVDLLRAYCRIEARDDERTIREKVTAKLLSLNEGPRSRLPAILTPSTRCRQVNPLPNPALSKKEGQGRASLPWRCSIAWWTACRPHLSPCW